ncbi:protocadherin Fat 1-like isoform X2 [Ptychodera flava]|uniref:protocadherin Fat 1-like isoform X2 n=1 Tax=Ptychodera flava TaxID=63121 RepID=UPI00396A556C
MASWKSRNWVVIYYVCLWVAFVSHSKAETEFKFTKDLYNATIPENSLIKTYVTPNEKMGIYVSDPTISIRFSIIEGESKLFKAVGTLVGDFYFLRIRTAPCRKGESSCRSTVLNREVQDEYRLTVEATVRNKRGGDELARTHVVIKVEDINDLRPLFEQSRYTVSVAEDTPLRSSIARVLATDADIGTNGDVYYSFHEQTNIFAIHPTSGVVTLTRPVNYLEQNEYKLTVKAQDRSLTTLPGHVSYSTASMTIQIVQVNKFAPEITEVHHTQVYEPGTSEKTYAIISVTDKDYGQNGEIDFVQIYSGDPANHFVLKQKSNTNEYNVKLRKALDRETTVGYNLTIYAADRGSPPKTSIKTIEVILLDRNDQAPVFVQDEYAVEVNEVAPIYTPVVGVKATDGDIGGNAKITYEIVSGNEAGDFEINSDTGFVYISKLLDRERKDSYRLVISATNTDHPRSRRQSTASVSITVLDANDNSPVFNQTSYLGTVEENLPEGTTVLTVNAVDDDAGENGYISYSIANLNTVPFAVDHFTGAITTTQVLDYESMRITYVLNIRASDWGEPFRREAEVNVTIKIMNTNDNKPIFEKIDCIGVISRDAPIDEPVTVVSALDFDDGNIISYEILSGNTNSLFELNSQTGDLFLTRQIQNSDPLFYNLKITAKDGTNFADPMYMNITIMNNRNVNAKRKNVQMQCQSTRVADELGVLLAKAGKDRRNKDSFVLDYQKLFNTNHYAPVFDSSIPNVLSVPEDLPVGSSILAVTATDNDHGYNGEVVYVIADGNMDSCFKIDTFTGVLTVQAELDREKRRSGYDLTISVADLGSPSQTDKKTIHVTLEDANDHKPVFYSMLYETTLPENVVKGTSILKVEASDRDQGTNGEVRFSIISDTDLFAIDPVSGDLTVAQSLDREITEVHVLKVQATDRSEDKPLSSVTTVTITLEDLNDNAPQFMPETYRVKLREDVPVGAVVTTIEARDPDQGGGGIVKYSLLSGFEDVFEIDEETGVVRLIAPLDYEQQQVYNITAKAKDKGTPRLSSTCKIEVEVIDVNENVHVPRFDDFVTNGSVYENSDIGTVVMQVVATDEDSGNDGRIVYSIRDGTGLGRFTIDDTGTIRTAEVLDRESQERYWLTVYAQDRGAVPLYSYIDVLIEVLDVNDNAPQTTEPVYYPSVMEDSPAGTTVVTIKASDPDTSSNQRLTFRISGGNPQGFFQIDEDTGEITTTNRKLDREHQEEHTLEVTVSDNGDPPMTSTARVIVSIDDLNDENPKFTDIMYSMSVPARERTSDREAIFRVFASDADKGENAELSYFIKDGDTKGKFFMEPQTGFLMTRKQLDPDDLYDLTLEVVDNGKVPKQRRSRARLIIQVRDKQQPSPHAPVIISDNPLPVYVMENDPINHMITVIEAADQDGGDLTFTIPAGSSGANKFFIHPTQGHLLLAEHLDWEEKSFYNVTVAVSDGFNVATCQVHVNVIDTNDNRPEFVEEQYSLEIPEDTEVDTVVLKVTATDRDKENRLSYVIHESTDPSSKGKFRIDSRTGVIYLQDRLDHETTRKHVLTVQAKDLGIPSKRAYVRVIISVRDSNDHTPAFSSANYIGRVYETAAVGSSIVQVVAMDKDRGENSELTYSIESGNLDDTFNIDPKLGIISVAKELDRENQPEYKLVVKVTDNGNPPLSNITKVSITVTISNNAPPKFESSEYNTNIYENMDAGSFVIQLNAISLSSVYYEILSGNEYAHFEMNAHSGVISTAVKLDYEDMMFYNLTVQATNMVGLMTQVSVIVHVSDRNDNPPVFVQSQYVGNISEGAPPGSVVLDDNNRPLVISATDDDTEMNAFLIYDIVESSAQQYFTIDANTGAIRTMQPLDHEAMPEFHFSVRVTDMGQPKLQAEKAAKVVVRIMDINDSPPVFTEEEFSATLLLPTYKDVAAAQVTAEDPDTGVNSQLHYSLVSGDPEGKFEMDSATGVIRVINASGLESQYKLQVKVSDGLFLSTTNVKIDVHQTTESGLLFSDDAYYAVVMENHTQVKTIAVVNALGNNLNEPLMYRILNPNDLFDIGSTSGVLKTTGIPFDREKQEKYEIVVEVRDLREVPRVAHVVVRVEVLDINDNAPMFVNLPYFAVVQVDAKVNDIVRQVTAIDRDIDKNGEVRYTLVDGGEGHFDIDSQTGEIKVIRALDSNVQNQEFTLKIMASDKGNPKLAAQVLVPISVMNKAMPVFQRAFYTASIKENIQLHTQVIHIQANSSNGRKLIYSITDGDTFNQFSIDHNTGVVSVVGPMDYEAQQQFRLTVRASDTLTGAYAEVVLAIDVEDVNDIAPIFTEQSYQVTVSEAVPIGTRITLVSSSDYDSGRNREVSYHFVEESAITDYFHIDSSSGLILTSRQLDHEKYTQHDFKVVAIDGGMPALTSETRVSVIVTDLNDNPPAFEKEVYRCSISELAERGSFVTMVTATDPDSSDGNRLVYSVVSGNEDMNFVIDSNTGIITLTNTRTPNVKGKYILDVSVSDGVFTSSASVVIEVTTVNRYAPVFSSVSYSAARPEDMLPDTHIVTVTARDDDEGSNGEVKYSIIGEEALEKFTIDPETGDIFSQKVMDHEDASEKTMVIPIMATDGGGKVAYSEVIVALTDVNDNAPVFELGEYKVNLHANIPAGSTVLTVVAVDSDIGSNAAIRYSIYDVDSFEMLDVFAVDPDSGVISTLKPLTGKESTVYQFFIQAEDDGERPLSSNVPVEVYILEPDEYPPVFEETNHVYHVFEDMRVGSEIATITARSNHSLVYSIVPGNGPNTNNPVKFSIDQEGLVVVSGDLDYETVRWHKLTVCAETETTPPLSAFVEVTIQLKDANDNAPKFEADPYVVSLPENAELDAKIIQVYADDIDSTSNSRITYSLSEDIEDVSGIFTIDPESGWISLLGELDRETKSKYVFGVTATDSNERNPLSDTTLVELEVTDFNDSPPQFEQSTYTAQISEEAEVGTEVITVVATDADVGSNAVLMYYITGGDLLGHFAIDGDTGQVTIQRALDREVKEMYMLNVTATDGAFTDVTLLVIDILDANDNSPICQQALYSELISESVPVGTYVVTVKAVDYDKGSNAEITYAIQGSQADAFLMNSKTGVMTTAAKLDRELHPVYTLHVTATDGGGRSCTTEISISLSDVNDNPPQFTHSVYQEWFSEKTAVKSLLTRVLATDPDTGMNRQVKYSFVDSADGTFAIDKDSGIISLIRELDREARDSYNLTIRATDSGTPKLTSVAHMEITVQDEDDNPPEFEYRDYRASVSEAVSVGHSIIAVLATSRDIGVNAEITYRLTGGNEHGKFRIDPKSGVITVVEPLDFEMASDYYLTVQAVDGGDQPQHDLTTVSINVTDANDNSPIFNQQIYSTEIPEAAQVGDSVLQVMASDVDSGPNGDVVYTIVHGDRLGQFHIDEKTGLISITSELDREKISAYSLVVRASDQGIDSQEFSDVSVQIRVSDINDNPPKFSSANYTVITQEDTEINTDLLEFLVTDSDAQPNGAPFTMEIVDGNEGNEFRITRDMKLRPMIRFNQGQKDLYHLRIRATDSGTPALWAETFVDVKVIVSKHPPIVSSPMEVTINSFEDDFPGGVIGTIHAEDNDEYDTLTYDLASNDKHLFMVDNDNGKIIALPDLDVGFYVINISVSDSKYTSYGEVRVNVEMVTRETLDNSLTIRFNDIRPEVFLEGYYRIFTRTLKNMLQFVELDDIKMVSLQETDFDSGDLDVLFAVEKSPDSYLKPKPLVRKINESKGALEERMGVTVSAVFSSICTDSMCDKTTRCKDNLALDQSSISAVSSTRTSFVSAKHVRSHSCVCKEKSEGCEELPTEEPYNPCEQNPCPDHMRCVAEGLTHRCMCADNSVDECVDPKYQPVSFSGSSYLHYNNLVLDTTSTRLSAKVRTMKPNGIIMYGEGNYDYSILEIENGFIQYRFQCGSGEGKVKISVQQVHDGQWHDVMVHRRGNNAKITLDNQHTVSDDAPGDKRELNLDDIFFGAEVSTNRRRKRDTVVSISNGLNGCMSDLTLNGDRLPTSGDGVTSKDVAECDYSEHSACQSSPCANGGICYDRHSGFKCECTIGWYGSTCKSTTPCGADPCRNGGTCSNKGTDFQCLCRDGYMGKTCTNYCASSPCKNGATCMESDEGPVCKCTSGFNGPRCSEDINECLNNPCETGPCTNTLGGYSCDCDDKNNPNPECNNINTAITSPHDTSKKFTISWIHIVIGAGAIVLIIIIVIIVVACRRRRRRKRRYSGKGKRHDNINDSLSGDAMMLKRVDNRDQYKRDSKLSNLEVPVNYAPVPPDIPQRPASYTPSNHTSLNNLDSDRNYDDDQNAYQGQPISQPPSLAPLPPSNSASDSDSIAKPVWDFEPVPPNVTDNYDNNVCKNLNQPNKKMVKQNLTNEEPYRQDGSRTNFSSLSSLQSENDEDMLPAATAKSDTDKVKRKSSLSLKANQCDKTTSTYRDAPPSSVKCVRFNMPPQVTNFEIDSSCSEQDLAAVTDRSLPKQISEMSFADAEQSPSPHQSAKLDQMNNNDHDNNNSMQNVATSPEIPEEKNVPSDNSPPEQEMMAEKKEPSEQDDDINAIPSQPPDQEMPPSTPMPIDCDLSDLESVRSDGELSQVGPEKADAECQTDDDVDAAENPFMGAEEPLETMTEFHDTHQTVYIHRTNKPKALKKRKNPGYHWDCTDWMPPDNLPEISELPQYEVPDSPTNSNVNDFIIEDEYVGEDTDYPEDPSDITYSHNAEDFQRQLENYPPPPPPPPPPHPEEGSYNSYRHREKLYRQHPGQYLPHHSYSNSQTSQDLYGNADEMYGPPPGYSSRGGRHQDGLDDEYGNGCEYNADYEHSVSNMDNLSVSVYSTNASCSDVSGLCEPDSEMGLSDYESGDDNLSNLHTEV